MKAILALLLCFAAFSASAVPILDAHTGQMQNNWQANWIFEVSDDGVVLGIDTYINGHLTLYIGRALLTEDWLYVGQNDVLIHLRRDGVNRSGETISWSFNLDAPIGPAPSDVITNIPDGGSTCLMLLAGLGLVVHFRGRLR